MFSKLFIEDRYDDANRILTFIRRPRGDGHPVCLAAGFIENIVFSYETSREKLLKCGYGERSLLLRGETEFSNGRGTPDVCGAFKVKLKLPVRGTAEITLALAAAATENEAADKILKMRESGAVKKGRGAREIFLDGGLESVLSEKILPRIIFGPFMTGEKRKELTETSCKRDTLWSMGISGDLRMFFTKSATGRSSCRFRRISG